MKIIKKIIIILIIALFPILIEAQPIPPPGQNGMNGNQGGPTGGGAPLDGGLSILFLLSATYYSNKVYRIRKNKK